MSDYQDYGYYNQEYNHVHSYLLPPLLKLLAQQPSRRILDIGCGNGWLTNCLIENGFDAYGTDASQKGIHIARQKNPNRFFIQDLTIDELPAELQVRTYDTIISTEVIEHLYAPRKYFDFCRRQLEKNGGGELIVSTPYHGYFKNIVLSLSGKMDQHFTTLWDGGHIKFWSKQTLTAIMQENGFRNITFQGCGRVPLLWKSMLMTGKL